VLNHVLAMRAEQLVVAELARRNKDAVIAVCDAAGELISLLRVGDPLISCVKVALDKAYTAARERQSSAEVGRTVRESGSGFDIVGYFGDARYTGWGGGIPVQHAGRTVGAIGVSGLDEAEDVELALLGAAALSAS
jgi:glc operon protein GlcG